MICCSIVIASAVFFQSEAPVLLKLPVCVGIMLMFYMIEYLAYPLFFKFGKYEVVEEYKFLWGGYKTKQEKKQQDKTNSGNKD